MLQVFVFIFCHVLMAQTIWNGTPTHMKILITPLTLTAMGTIKNQKQKKHKPTKVDYNSSKEFYIGQNPPAGLPPEIDVCNCNNPKTKKYSYWYPTNPDEQPTKGLVCSKVAYFYCIDLSFLDHKNYLQELDCNDCKQCKFLQG